MTEAQMQSTIVEAATLLGYLVHHVRPARTDKGWRTPLQGHKGFPDLVICGHGRCLFVELKSKRGRPSEEQLRWEAGLEMAGQQYRLIRPDGLDAFLHELNWNVPSHSVPSRV